MDFVSTDVALLGFWGWEEGVDGSSSYPFQQKDKKPAMSTNFRQKYKAGASSRRARRQAAIVVFVERAPRGPGVRQN